MKRIITIYIMLIIFINNIAYSEQKMTANSVRLGDSITFTLPYCKEKNRSKYFKQNVKSALIIDEILIDGEKLLPEYDYASYFGLTDEYKTQYVRKSNDSLCMEMYWEKNRKGEWTFSYRGYKYKVTPMTEVTVFYRVIFPFPFGTAERLLQRRFDSKYISKAYFATILLPDIE